MNKFSELKKKIKKTEKKKRTINIALDRRCHSSFHITQGVIISLKIKLLSIDMDIQVIIEPLIQSLKLIQSLDSDNSSNSCFKLC